MRAEQVLPDDVNQRDINGLTVRKGTVGAFLVNAKAWSDPSTDAAARALVQRDIVEALPALRALGVFDVFTLRHDALRRFVEAN